MENEKIGLLNWQIQSSQEDYSGNKIPQLIVGGSIIYTRYSLSVALTVTSSVSSIICSSLLNSSIHLHSSGYLREIKNKIIIYTIPAIESLLLASVWRTFWSIAVFHKFSFGFVALWVNFTEVNLADSFLSSLRVKLVSGEE